MFIEDYNQEYYQKQLITYIGNKRSLLWFISFEVKKIQDKLWGWKLDIFDWFSWSWAVSRMLKSYSKNLYVNDLEWYSKTINEAYLSNKSSYDTLKIKNYIDFLNKNKNIAIEWWFDFIEKNYSPKNTKNVKEGERCFYTRENAVIIDNIRNHIKTLDSEYQKFWLAQLLIKSSIHVNTSWVFKWFHKKNGIWHFWWKWENALSRIMWEIILDYPIFSNYESNINVYQEDTNKLIGTLHDLDIAYYDPPYNQHPYWSNYFMLNIINDGKTAQIQRWVSWIIEDWNRSTYNKNKQAQESMENLIEKTNSKYIIISYNSEWIISYSQMLEICSKFWKVEIIEKKYNTYRWSRNLKNRNSHVTELLWIIQK